ncbi:hypothetical protein Zm00014a_029880 [Zea mays]|uniref:DUF1664 domain-containing protein n=1 Tax=Zea mays TaxID=4577 RepID=A0A3L6FS15_MAIZE|nr:hypothetical protein Zm00014a_029880 [Zea mays]
MAMVQAGMGLGRIVLLIGVGAVGGPIAVRSGKLGELLRDLQESLSEKGAAAVNDDVNTVVAKALAQMTKEINHIATRISQPMIHVDTGNGAAKKHLSQRIQNVDDKLEQQKEISVQIKDQVIDAKLKFKNIGSDMDKLKNMVMGLDDKMDSIEAKQNYSCVAVDYLCQFIEERVDKLPEQLEGLQQTVKRIGYRSPELPPGLGGLQQLLATGSATHSSTRMFRSTGAARLILP